MKKSILVVLLLFGLACSAGAAIVYDNGAPNLSGGNEMTQWIQAEDFSLGTTETITGVNFWALESNSYAGSIWYGIFSDDGGLPNLGAPNVLGFSEATNVVRTDTGDTYAGYSLFSYSFDITSFDAIAGETYWLGLHNGPLSTNNRLNFYWANAATNGTSYAMEDVTPFGNGWYSNSAEHAFQLTTAPVPEPSTWLLLGTGLAGLAYYRRKKS